METVDQNNGKANRKSNIKLTIAIKLTVDLTPTRIKPGATVIYPTNLTNTCAVVLASLRLENNNFSTYIFI